MYLSVGPGYEMYLSVGPGYEMYLSVGPGYEMYLSVGPGYEMYLSVGPRAGFRNGQAGQLPRSLHSLGASTYLMKKKLGKEKCICECLSGS